MQVPLHTWLSGLAGALVAIGVFVALRLLAWFLELRGLEASPSSALARWCARCWRRRPAATLAWGTLCGVGLGYLGYWLAQAAQDIVERSVYVDEIATPIGVRLFWRYFAYDRDLFGAYDQGLALLSAALIGAVTLAGWGALVVALRHASLGRRREALLFEFTVLILSVFAYALAMSTAVAWIEGEAWTTSARTLGQAMELPAVGVLVFVAPALGALGPRIAFAWLWLAARLWSRDRRYAPRVRRWSWAGAAASGVLVGAGLYVYKTQLS